MTLSDAGQPQIPARTAPGNEVACPVEPLGGRRRFELLYRKRNSLARSTARRASACRYTTVEGCWAMFEANEKEPKALLRRRLAPGRSERLFSGIEVALETIDARRRVHPKIENCL